MSKKSPMDRIEKGKKSQKHTQGHNPLPLKSVFDITDQDAKRRIGHFGGTGEPHMQKRGRGDR